MSAQSINLRAALSSPLRGRNDVQGNVFIELAVVLPFILALVFFGIEIGRVMQASEVTIGLSRELAVTAMRGCLAKLPADLDKPPSDALAPCLRNELRHFRTASAGLAPVSSMVVTFYRSDGGAGIDGPYRVGQIARSKFGLQDIILNRAGVGTALEQNKRIVVAEVIVPFNTILPRMPGISGGLDQNEMYAYAVL